KEPLRPQRSHLASRNMLDISSEPRVAGSRFSNSIISSEAYNVDDFFKSTPASEWLLGSYVNGIIEGPRHGGQGNQTVGIALSRTGGSITFGGIDLEYII
ncbi:25331_t:CDS:2, partial [Gigaspora margarita]